MTSKAIQIRDIQTTTTGCQAVAVQMTCASPVVPTLPMPPADWCGAEGLATANPYRGSLGEGFDAAAHGAA